jgi:putative DNA primase/helicase
MTVLELALAYHAAGLGVLPVRPDGSKAPALSRGHRYLRRRPTEGDLRRWFAAGRNGIAVACGRVSGNLETLDFETVAVCRRWCRLVEARAPSLVGRLCWVRTPGHLGQPGMHARYRCPGITIPGPTALAAEPEGGDIAQRPALTGRPRARLLIETRGEGSYAIAPGSPAGCHETGRPWEHVAGPDLAHLPELTPCERGVLVDCARALDTWMPAPRAAPRQDATAPAAGPCVQDDFNRRGPDWADVLGPHGWILVRAAGAVRYWRRPGKARGSWSATTGFCHSREGYDLLHVFSSNASPFQPGGSYSKFRVHALLNHQGDSQAAARDLAARGFGGPPPPGSQQPEEGRAEPRDPGHAETRLPVSSVCPSPVGLGPPASGLTAPSEHMETVALVLVVTAHRPACPVGSTGACRAPRLGAGVSGQPSE